jgi:DMSO/TMAO reductase YedYZ heme-binding membrane subunit
VAVYAAILAVLLGWRVREFLRRRQARRPAAGASGARPSR